MGDYTNDGYNDLVIANNGDNLITLFEGGPTAVLTNSKFWASPYVRRTW